MSLDIIRREIARAAAGSRHAFRAVLKTLALATRVQRVGGDGLAGEDLQDTELFQHFGFTSAPPAGTQYIVLPLGGRTSASVIVATESGAHRLALDAQGECRIYNQWGDYVHLKQDRSIHVKAQARVFVETEVFRVEASQRIELVSPDILLQASNKVTGTTPLVDLSQNLTVAQLTNTQNFTIGIGGAGGVANMNGGTVNYTGVAFNHLNSTETRSGGSITDNGKRIDGTHTHGGVQTGGGDTATPNP